MINTIFIRMPLSDPLHWIKITFMWHLLHNFGIKNENVSWYLLSLAQSCQRECIWFPLSVRKGIACQAVKENSPLLAISVKVDMYIFSSPSYKESVLRIRIGTYDLKNWTKSHIVTCPSIWSCRLRYAGKNGSFPHHFLIILRQLTDGNNPHLRMTLNLNSS